MATHSSFLAWRIPWTEEPGGLQPLGSQRIGHTCSTLFCIFQALNQPRARHQRTRDRLHVPCYAILCHFSCARLFMTPGTVARQAPLSMGFSRQEHWSGLPFPPLRDLPDPGIEPISHVSCIGRKVLYHQHHQACWNYSS